MSQTSADIEALLRSVLVPVEPAPKVRKRVHSALKGLNQLAEEELETWELAAMRDPRNWLRPALALGLGTATGAGLLALKYAPALRRRGR